MNIEIRRNRDISFGISMEKNKESVEKLMELFREPTPEESKLADECEKNRNELEKKIWAYFDEHPTNDLNGSPIKRETHEVGFDLEYKEIGVGTMVGVAKNVFVRPKESELKGGEK